MPDQAKIHFANFFDVYANPATDMVNNEVGFTSDFKLIYKDENGVIHTLPSVADYANIYNPSAVSVTQTVKEAVVGVGTEGDNSAKVTVSIPKSCVITATGINERQVLIHYDKNNNIKSILPLPEHFCKLGSDADTFDVNAGIVKERIKATKIQVQPVRTALTNNAIFKVMHLDTNVVQTSFGYALTTEANKDVIANRDNIYIGADGYLYIIKDIAVTSLTLPFMVYNKRTTPIDIKIPTTYFLFDKDDMFKVKTYRRFTGLADATSHEFITSSESVVISDILRGVSITSDKISQELLSISANGKSIEGLVDDVYYDIIVITSEVGVNPTIAYSFYELTSGFVSYIYSVIKSISDNANGIGDSSIDGPATNYLIPFSHTIEANDATQFTIDPDLYAPSLGDILQLNYQFTSQDIPSSKVLRQDVDFSVDLDTNIVTLNFTVLANDVVHGYIYKQANGASETLLLQKLQEMFLRMDELDQMGTDLTTPTYSTLVTATASIFSLPSTGIKSYFNVFEIQGNTEINLITNGNFIGTTGWTGIYSSISAANNVLSITANGANVAGRAFNTMNIYQVANKKLYVKATVRVTNSSCVNIILQLRSSDGSSILGVVATQANPTNNTFYTLSGIVTLTNTATDTMSVYILEEYADTTTANGKVMEVKEVVTIDLTTRFGTGNEPNLATCNLRYLNWFDGTKSLGPIELITTGKNLFNPRAPYTKPNGQGAIVTPLANGFKLRGSTASYDIAKFELKLKPNTAYTFSRTITSIIVGGSTENGKILIMDSSGNTWLGELLRTNNNPITITTTSTGSILIGFYGTINVAGSTEFDFTNLQLVEGSTAIPYEPYFESIAPINLPFTPKRVGSIFDTIDLLSGKIIKYNSEYILTASDIVQLYTGATNIDVVYSKQNTVTDNKSWTDSIDTHVEVDGKEQVANTVPALDTTASIGKYASTSTQGIAFVVAKGTYANLAAAQAALAGNKIRYQLATPTISYIPPQSLSAKLGGSVQIFNRYEERGFYANGISIVNTAYPIKSLVSVIKVNLETGTETPIDPFTCTIASNGLSFTSTSLVDQDFVVFKVEYDSALSVLPTISYKCAANTRAESDEANLTIKLVDDKVDKTNQQVMMMGAHIDRLNDQIINPTYTTIETVTGSIFSIPKLDYGRYFNAFTAKGDLRTNLVQNSGMSVDLDSNGGADGWTSATGGVTAAYSIDTTKKAQKIVISASASAQNAEMHQYIPVNPGDVLSGQVEIETGALTGTMKAVFSLQAVDSNKAFISEIKTPMLITTSNLVSTVYKLENGTCPANTAYIKFVCRLSCYSIGDTGTAWFKNAMLERATTSGLYIASGIRCSGPVEIVATGKNLFNFRETLLFKQNPTLASIVVEDGKLCWKISSPSTFYSKTLISNIFKPNTQYTLRTVRKSPSCGLTLSFLYTDGTSGAASSVATQSAFAETIATSASGKTVSAIICSYGSGAADAWFELDTFVLNEGSTAISVEPYTESISKVPFELKKITSSDIISILTGEYTKYNSDFTIIDGSKTWVADTDASGYKIAYFALSALSGLPASSIAMIGTKYNGKLLTSTVYSSMSAGDQIGTGTNGLAISVLDADSGFPESYTPTAAEWKAYFYGWKMCASDGNTYSSGIKYWKKITDGTGITPILPIASYTGYIPYRFAYQLSKPILGSILSQNISLKSAGTVYVYNRYEDYDFYDNGAFITKIDYPIKTLLSVSKFDLETGVEIPIDITTCTIINSGLGFISTALSNTDFVWFKIEYDNSYNIAATYTYNYDSNLNSVIDETTQVVKRLDADIDKTSQQISILGDNVDRLNDQIINPTYSTLQTLNASIFSLPSTGIEAYFNRFEIYGNTEINAVKNGNFVNDATGWTIEGAVNSVSANVLTNTGNGTMLNPIARTTTQMPLSNGKKVYARAFVRVTNAVCSQIVFQAYDSSGNWITNFSVQTSPVQNQLYVMEGIATIGAQTGTLQIKITHFYADAATSNGKVMEVRDVVAVDLTTRFGAGSEPLLAECVSRYSRYFDQVKSVGPIEVISTGKNLCSGWEVGGVSSTGFDFANANMMRTKGYIKVSPNTTYAINTTEFAINARYLFFYDANKKFISFADTSVTAYATAPAGAVYVRGRIDKVSAVTNSDIQGKNMLNVGSAILPYEPYIASSIYIPYEQKGILATQDIFDIISGKLFKKVSNWLSLETISNWAATNRTGFKSIVWGDIITTAKVSSAVRVINPNGIELKSAEATDYTTTEGNAAWMSPSGYLLLSVLNADTGWIDALTPTATEIRAYLYGWKMCASDGTAYVSGTKYWKKITDGTGVTSTLPTASYSGFTPYKVIYQLATPIESYLSQILTLKSGGDVQINFAFQDYDFYTTGAFISNTSYPIKTLKSVYKVSLQSGLPLVPIDISTCTIAGDGLSFTSTALTSGDLVWFVADYDSALSCNPTTIYQYDTNLKSQTASLTEAVKGVDERLDKVQTLVQANLFTQGGSIAPSAGWWLQEL